VPQQAVQRGSTGDSVMVVDGEGKVTPRPVKVGTAQSGNWVILDGVKTGEMVMVDGFQKLRGAAPVKPVPWQPAGASSAPGGAAASAASAPR
jgi:membrane fusion protein (multidrug efflux system)